MNLSAWKYYTKFYRGSQKRLILSILVSIVQSLTVLPIVLLVRYIFDEIVANGNTKMLVLIGLGIILLNIINSALTLWSRHINLGLVKAAIQRMREDVLNRIYTFSRTYYNNSEIGKIHSNIVQDTHRLDTMSYVLIANLIPGFIMAVAVSAILVFLNWYLFIVMLCAIPLLILVNRILGKRVKEKVQAWRQTFRNFSKGILFILQIIDLTRIQSAEHFEKKQQKTNFDKLRSAGSSLMWLQTAYSTIQQTIVASSGIFVLIFGGIAILNGSMSMGELLSFYVAVGLLKSYLGPLVTSIPQVIEGSESLISLHNIITTNDYVPYSGNRIIEFNGAVDLHSVYFEYNEEPVLNGVDLTVKPNEIIAILGANGAGKTTIINLILGFYRPQKGRLLANGNVYSELNIEHLRRSIGVVTQEPVLFTGTIADNITYSNHPNDSEQVIQAAKVAGAHEFIGSLAEGYNTLVGENGVRLSGGQRQRIAIARAFLRQPKLLILDEPTNHLDDAAVQLLVHNLKEMRHKPAILMISHDEEIVNLAQKVYLLKNGKIQPARDYRNSTFMKTISATGRA